MFILESRFKHSSIFAEENLAIDQVNVATDNVLVFGALKRLSVFLAIRLRSVSQLPSRIKSIAVKIIAKSSFCLSSASTHTQFEIASVK